MSDKDYLNIATKHAHQNGCSLVEFAGREGGKRFYTYRKPNLPRYGSLPNVMSVDVRGNVTELNSIDDRVKISNMAYELKHH